MSMGAPKPIKHILKQIFGATRIGLNTISYSGGGVCQKFY